MNDLPIYNEGRYANLDGVKLKDCPYKGIEKQWWQDGWRFSESLMKKLINRKSGKLSDQQSQDL